ncbi:MAG: glutaredoxin family protein [Microcella sp.]|uniref:glutaredoxin family protein n=1 Tax=Microcella sp. TaxID=1913979 RepID=UPI0024C55D06|nr:glutaredoxin family protein [Microcella sp.]UYN83257.1 MAG: glutaredoxin family protein [Microcella sp.]
MPAAIVTLLSKPGCHLCDDARAVVAEVVRDFPNAELVEASILDDAELHARYWDEIPVVLIDDVVHCIYRVDPGRLRAALAERGH